MTETTDQIRSAHEIVPELREELEVSRNEALDLRQQLSEAAVLLLAESRKLEEALAQRDEAIECGGERYGIPKLPGVLFYCKDHARTIHEIMEQHDRYRQERDEVRAELKQLKKTVPREPFDVRCADAMADEVDVLISRKVIDCRSPAADALLDYRDPPRTPRSDRLAELERGNAQLRESIKKHSELCADAVHEQGESYKTLRTAAINSLKEIRDDVNPRSMMLFGHGDTHGSAPGVWSAKWRALKSKAREAIEELKKLES